MLLQHVPLSMAWHGIALYSERIHSSAVMHTEELDLAESSALPCYLASQLVSQSSADNILSMLACNACEAFCNNYCAVFTVDRASPHGAAAEPLIPWNVLVDYSVVL